MAPSEQSECEDVLEKFAFLTHLAQSELQRLGESRTNTARGQPLSRFVNNQKAYREWLSRWVKSGQPPTEADKAQEDHNLSETMAGYATLGIAYTRGMKASTTVGYTANEISEQAGDVKSDGISGAWGEHSYHEVSNAGY